jgi:hypothetical protein
MLRLKNKGETPLHLAARSGEPEALELLLAWGANKYMINAGRQTVIEALESIRTGLVAGYTGNQPPRAWPRRGGMAGGNLTRVVSLGGAIAKRVERGVIVLV